MSRYPILLLLSWAGFVAVGTLACSEKVSPGVPSPRAWAGCEQPEEWLDGVIKELGLVAYEYFVLGDADREMDRGIKPVDFEDEAHDPYRHAVLAVLDKYVFVPSGYWETAAGRRELGQILAGLYTLRWQNWKIEEYDPGEHNDASTLQYLVSLTPFGFGPEEYLVQVTGKDGSCWIVGLEALRGPFAPPQERE